jgi:hypothetical protein
VRKRERKTERKKEGVDRKLRIEWRDIERGRERERKKE